MLTVSERHIRNALKFGTTGKVDSKEGEAIAEEFLLAPPNCSEVGTPQLDLGGTVSPRRIQQPVPQHPQTKLIFDVRIDYPLLG